MKQSQLFFVVLVLFSLFIPIKLFAMTVDAGTNVTLNYSTAEVGSCGNISGPSYSFTLASINTTSSTGINNVTAGKSGTYTLACTGKDGSQKSASDTLTVNPLINGSCASKCINFGNGLNCSASTYDVLSPLCSNGTVTAQNTYTTYSAWGCTGSGGGTSASGCSACAPGYKGNGCIPITIGDRTCDGSTCGTGTYAASCNFDSCPAGPTTCPRTACTIDCPNPNGTTTTYPAGTTCPTWTKYCTPYNDINGNNYQKWAYTNPLSGSSSWLHVPAEDSQCLWSATTCSASPACGTTDTYTQSWTCASNPSLCATNGHPDTTCSRTVCSCSATGWSTWNASAHQGTSGTTCGTYLSGYTLAANSSDTITSTRSTYSGSFQISCDAAGNFSNLRNFSCVPNTDCVGAWSDNTTCSVSGACNQTGVFKQTYTISQAQSGTGTACPYLNGAIRTPTSGGTACYTAVCSCSNQTKTWGTSSSCSASTGVISNSANTPSITNTVATYTGSAVFSCNGSNDSYAPVSGSCSCATPTTGSQTIQCSSRNAAWAGTIDQTRSKDAVPTCAWGGWTDVSNTCACATPLTQDVTVACDAVTGNSVTGHVTRRITKSSYSTCTFPSTPYTPANSTYIPNSEIPGSDTCVYTCNNGANNPTTCTTPTGSITLTPSQCVIAQDSNSCSTSAYSAGSNIASGKTSLSIDGVLWANVGSTNTQTWSSVTRAGNTFRLYSEWSLGGILLDTKSVTAVCTAGTTFDGSGYCRKDPCTNQTKTWGTDSRCSASTGSTPTGTNTGSLTNTVAGYTGSGVFSCNGGTSNTYTPVSGSCTMNAPVLTWVGPSSCDNNWLNIAWSVVPSATSYDVYRDGALLLSTTTTAISDTGLSFGSSHSYYVKAKNSSMTSVQSGTLSATVSNPCTATITITKSGSGTGTVTSSPSGMNCGATCSKAYTFGSSVNFTPSYSVDSVFVGWTGSCSAAGIVTADAAKTCNAQFDLGVCANGLTQDVTVACDPNPNGNGNAAVSGLVTRRQTKSAYPECIYPALPITNANSVYVSDNCKYNNATCGTITAPASISTWRTFTASVQMNNPVAGSKSTTWTTGSSYNLGSQNATDNVTWGTNRVALPSSVSPGNSVTFSKTFTAPAISGVQSFSWKMVQDGREWFGDTCSVNINVIGECLPPFTQLVTVPCDAHAGNTITGGLVTRTQTKLPYNTCTFPVDPGTGSVYSSDNCTYSCNNGSAFPYPASPSCPLPIVTNSSLSGNNTPNGVLDFTCSDTVSYTITRDGAAVTSGAYTGPTSIQLSNFGSIMGYYTIQCLSGTAVPGSKTLPQYDPKPLTTDAVTLDAVPGTIKTGITTTLNWGINIPDNACTITASAVCPGGTCISPRDSSRVADANNLSSQLLSGNTDANDPYGANRLMTTALRTKVVGLKALGKKSLKLQYTTDFLLDCHINVVGRPNPTKKLRVQVTTDNEG